MQMKLFEYQKGNFKMSASIRKTTTREKIEGIIALVIIGIVVWWVMK